MVEIAFKGIYLRSKRFSYILSEFKSTKKYLSVKTNYAKNNALLMNYNIITINKWVFSYYLMNNRVCWATNTVRWWDNWTWIKSSCHCADEYHKSFDNWWASAHNVSPQNLEPTDGLWNEIKVGNCYFRLRIILFRIVICHFVVWTQVWDNLRADALQSCAIVDDWVAPGGHYHTDG